MMLETDYARDNPALWLTQLLEALVRNCRYLCSLGMHTQGMTVDEATQFFQAHAYMEEHPARQEALRGTFDPGYLNYTLGKLMLLKLRQDWRRQEGSAYTLRRFHDAVLSWGAPPVSLLREAMLDRAGGVYPVSSPGKPHADRGQYTAHTFPMMWSDGSGPQWRESWLPRRLSPITKYSSSSSATVCIELRPSSVRYGSPSGVPFTLHPPVGDGYQIARLTDDAFNELTPGVFRVVEHHHVAAPGRSAQVHFSGVCWLPEGDNHAQPLACPAESTPACSPSGNGRAAAWAACWSPSTRKFTSAAWMAMNITIPIIAASSSSLNQPVSFMPPFYQTALTTFRRRITITIPSGPAVTAGWPACRRIVFTQRWSYVRAQRKRTEGVLRQRASPTGQ